MPFRKLQTSAGYVDVNYQISTPSNADASAIDSDLPTILFLHGNYLGSVLFHSEWTHEKRVALCAGMLEQVLFGVDQLNDTSVRRFNCVSFDARGQHVSAMLLWGKVFANHTLILAVPPLAR